MSKKIYAAVIVGSMLVGSAAWESAKATYNALFPTQETTITRTYELDDSKMKIQYNSESADRLDRIVFGRRLLGENARLADVGGIALACDKNIDGKVTNDELERLSKNTAAGLNDKYGLLKESDGYTPMPSEEAAETDAPETKSKTPADKTK